MDVTRLSKCSYEGFIVILSASASMAHPHTGMSIEFRARRYHWHPMCLCSASPPQWPPQERPVIWGS